MNTSAHGRITGSYRRNPRGFGFLTPEGSDGSEDVYLSRREAEGLISGDTVSAIVAKRGKRDGRMRYQARDVVLIKRERTRFVGELQRRARHWIVIPDGRDTGTAIDVTPQASAGAGDLVVVELTCMENAKRVQPTGRIVRVLGRRGDPGVDVVGVIEQYQLPSEFDKGALAEADASAASYDPVRIAPEREDLRMRTVVTIDPPAAKDFDDAISLARNPDGTTELGVHIADVAHFIPAGGVLDAAARERATSVYLGNTVIPMLPEALSNGVCSLQEGQDRLAKSVLITYGPRGAVRAVRFANSIIRSAKRLTYTEVDHILGGDDQVGAMTRDIVTLIVEMAELARVLRKRRLRAGMLVLDLPEADLILDEKGQAVGVADADPGFAHTMIEMFMVETNEAVAQLLTKNHLRFLRRVHEEPAAPSWQSLGRFLEALGFKLHSKPVRKALQEALDHFRVRSEVRAVHLAVLRSMQKAHYAPDREGHYALASRDYCHFTSPIRRYPDLTVHRLLDSYLQFETAGGPLASGRNALRGRKGQSGADRPDELRMTGDHCSALERRAEAAEKEFKLVVMLRLLAARGEAIYQSVVTGVAKRGIFVQLEGYWIEGCIPFDQLRQDRWRSDADRGCAVGLGTGRRIVVGDVLAVRVGRIDLAARQLELLTAGPLPRHRAQRADRRSIKREGRGSDKGKWDRKRRRRTRDNAAQRRRPGGNE